MTTTSLSKRHPLALCVFAAINLFSAAYAISPNLVISQVYGGGGNTGSVYKNDFIELLNRSSSAVNLGGLSVQYASSAGSTWSKTDLTNVILQPGQYYLVQEAVGAGGTTNLPTPDATGTIAMSGTAGKVALVSNQTILTGACPSLNVIDLIGFGAANCSETNPTPALTNTTADLRTSGGCTETDNNSIDFASGAPNPRNSGSALNTSCAAAPTPTLSLLVSTNTRGEADATVITVTASTSVAVTSDQTVNIIVNGTGITIDDYVLSNTIITIPNGSNSGTVTFTVTDDQFAESTEVATLTLSNPSAGISLGALTTQNISIIDNDIAPGNACGDPATKISAVQGSSSITPLNGIANTAIEGIVVGDYQGTSTNSLRGFFVQEEDTDADGNPTTSEGVFVFDGTTTLVNVSVGDRVRVMGIPTEFFEMTQIGAVTSVQVCASNQVIPSASSLTLPVPNVINGNLVNATNAINAYYEAYEGMLVKFPTTLKVSEYFELERYGQLVLSQGGRIPTFTSVSKPSTTGLIDHEITLAKRQIILDDSNNIQNYALSSGLPLPYPTGGLSVTNRFRGGDTITNLTGVLHWSFAGLTGTDAWRIRPVEELFDYIFTPANPRKTVLPIVGGDLKVASFNLLNYFTTIDTTASSTSGPCGPNGIQDCRGADSAAERVRQTEKAAAALCRINADIVGLMEIENNTTASLSSLTNAISGCGPYDFINTGTIGTSPTTGDAIKVGLLYKNSAVSAVGSHALLTTSVDGRFIDTKNRPTLAQTFRQISTGEKLTVAVNHLKSKGSDCLDVLDPDLNDGQGNCSQTRKNAALALVDWLNSDPTSSGDPDFLIIGDLNSYAKEDTIKAIENGPDDAPGTFDDYTNLVKAFGGDSAYSYVFDGQTGYLDHALASKTLMPQVTGTGDWHINADEPPSFDYNDTIKDTGEAAFEAKPAALPLYAADQFRTSDHDPVIIGLKLGEAINIIEGTPAKNNLTGSAGKDRITGFVGADILSGGLNADEFVYATTGDGIDTIIDFTLGEDKIVLTALMQSLGYQGADPLADGMIKFTPFGNNTVVYIDADGAGPAVQRALIIVNNVTALSLNNAANFIF
jgi:uncharacterized protein